MEVFPKKEIRHIGAGALKRGDEERKRRVEGGRGRGKLQRGGEIRRRQRKKRQDQERRRQKKTRTPNPPKAVASKLWLVLTHPESDVQPFVPPVPVPPMLGRDHHFFLLEVEVEGGGREKKK
jgi:hypothetical protein